MGRLGRLSLLWVLVVSLTTSVFMAPAIPARADDCRRVQNILVLFDASGFMNERDRYEALLKAMGLFQKAMPLTADGFFNVGVRHYGLRIGLRCQNTESILAIQPWDPERFLSAFPKTVSYGVSSLSAGLMGAAQDAGAAEGKTLILVIGGGIESCKANPLKITDQICFNNPDIEIHTVQVGTDQEGRHYLEQIAKLGKGTYNTLPELGSLAGWHAWMKRFLVVRCASAAPPAPGGADATPQLPPVYFDNNSVSVKSKVPDIDANNRAAIEALGLYMQKDPSARVVLHGLSDGKGSKDYNLKLSRRRANAVAAVLMRSYGVQAARISIVPHGEASPAGRAPGGAADPSGRRVEFQILRPPAQ